MAESVLVKPRAWHDGEGCSSTVILSVPTATPGVHAGLYMHTNIGWVPVVIEDGASIEETAVRVAASYKLTETDAERFIDDGGEAQ
jgi:hypothetical protein